MLFRYNVTGNFWIRQTDYDACLSSQAAVVNAQLQFSNGNFYLFSGTLSSWEEAVPYQSLCSYNNKTQIWQIVQEEIEAIYTESGGSCIYGNYLYYFFGTYLGAGAVGASSSVVSFSLLNVNQGPVNVAVQGCKGYLARSSFGYSCDASQFYVFGGFINSQATNSVLNFTLTSSTSIACEVVYEDSLSPGPRQGSTMMYLTGGFYLFGGENQGVLLNDLWFYDILHADWEEIYAQGTIPSPRRRHAADMNGEYMVIVGGIGLNEILLGDYYLYNINSQTWTQLVPATSSLIPPPVASTCVMLLLPVFYYVGGQLEEGLTLDLWKFDISDLQFTLIHEYNSDGSNWNLDFCN